MNNFLPANIGTFVTLLMFVAIIPGCTFAGAIAAYLVQKIFFTIAGTFVYLYLFLSVRARSTRTWATSRTTRRSRSDRRRRLLLVVSSAGSSGAGEEALGAGEAGRRDPQAAEEVPSRTHSCPRSSPGSASWR